MTTVMTQHEHLHLTEDSGGNLSGGMQVANDLDASENPVGPDGLTTGQRIRQLREAKRWSQPELASRIGVAVQTVTRVETGVSGLPIRSNLYRYANALGTTVDYLLTGQMSADEAHTEYRVEEFLRGYADIENPEDQEYLVNTWKMLRALQKARERGTLPDDMADE